MKSNSDFQTNYNHTRRSYSKTREKRDQGRGVLGGQESPIYCYLWAVAHDGPYIHLVMIGHSSVGPSEAIPGGLGG
jgi:hypothetical protein